MPSRLGAYVRRPRLIAHRLRRALYDIRHPGAPWLAPAAIRYCDEHLTRDMTALEWGSGRSTTWFGRRVGRLISVEHDPAWHARVTKALADADCRNVECRLALLDHAPHEPDRADVTTVPAYVAVAGEFADASLDFVVVDGRYRPLCVMAAIPKLRPGAMLLVDDVSQLPGLAEDLLPGWPLVCSSRGVAATSIWRKPA